MSIELPALCALDAVDLARLLATRQVSAREVTETFVEHAAAVDPAVNALVTRTFDDALQRADRLDRELTRDRARDQARPGLLHGVPVAHKDLADTAGVRTTYGSTVFAYHLPVADALHVARMTAAGAVCLGKTNTPEFGAGSQTFNKVFGATVNPYDPTLTSGGSSGGAAAALAVRSIALADGSDMGGSLRNPAAFCNVVGLRPTPGRVPDPTAADAWSPLGVVGPMGRTVADVALLLAVIAGPDPQVPMSTLGGAAWAPAATASASAPAAAAAATTLTEVIDAVRHPIGPPRVAWSPDLGGLPLDAAIRTTLSGIPDLLSDLGWQVQQAEPEWGGVDETFATLRAHAYALSLESVLREHPDQLKDTVVWNIEQGLALTTAELRAAQRRATALLRSAARFWDRFDLLVCPTTQVPPFDVNTAWVREIDGVTMQTYVQWMASATRVTMLGAPAMSLPAGFTAGGLPIGVQLVAPPGRDWDLLRWAGRLEAATGHARRLPPLLT